MNTATATASTLHGAMSVPVAQIAKSALRRLALEKLEPTPENYAMAFRLESGTPAPPALPGDAQAVLQTLVARAFAGEDPERGRGVVRALVAGQWARASNLLDAGEPGANGLADLIDAVVQGVERGGRHWTRARRMEGLRRVLNASRRDGAQLRARLSQLLRHWSADQPDDVVELGGDAPVNVESPHADTASTMPPTNASPMQPVDSTSEQVARESDPADLHWRGLAMPLIEAIRAALPTGDAEGERLIAALDAATDRLRSLDPDEALVEDVGAISRDCVRVLGHRHHLVELLGRLSREMTDSLIELSEEESWVRGQCEAMRQVLDGGLSARSVKAVTELLARTRGEQAQMRAERSRARDTLKALFNQMLCELGEIGAQTGRFQGNLHNFTDAIESAESLESLSGVVRDIVEESRSVHAVVAQTQQRLADEHAKATDLSQRVRELEDELERLASEVTTDQLTQVANRRGLLAVFEKEVERMERADGTLAIGLLDIDNFKRLNDELGHNAGDEALRSLASAVSKSLRPDDTVARYGGEEFVVLLPDTSLDTAQQVLTRLQRQLSSGLFLLEQHKVMVTFSAGVTAYRGDERFEDALERADRALFEAKRTGKNRTCAA